MSTTHAEAKISESELLRAVEKLNPKELERVTEHVLAFRNRRVGSHLSKTDAKLLFHVNLGLPDELSKEAARLRELLEDEKLSKDEHVRLIQLNDLEEEYNVWRIGTLAAVAHSRGTTLTLLMK